jgi:pSer/pThr/pTyr-binding forkhead associated (FHA) protein
LVQDNLFMPRPEGSRKRIARTLSAAYADGLLSEETFTSRLEEVLNARLLDRRRLIGDLHLRPTGRRTWPRLRDGARAAVARLTGFDPSADLTLLALDWSGAQEDLLVGRDQGCDVVLADPTVSRQHARLVFRGSRWIIQDLHSTNGTVLNGDRIGRSELHPGDQLVLGLERLMVD